ncbi:MAG: type IV pilus assembly protein PilM [Elusimicrobiota bacterium]
MAGLQDKLKGIDLKGLKDKIGSILMGSSDVLGVDIGSYAVKVVSFKKVGEGLKLQAAGYLPIGAKADSSPEERQQQAINRLKAFLIEKSIQIKHAATSISGNAVIVRYVKFPQLTKDELRATLATEAEPFIPFDINDVQLGFHILNDIVEEGQKKMETVLVAAKKEAVEARVQALEAVGLRPAIIDVDSFALENVNEQAADPQQTVGSTLYLNIGHTVTNLSIIEDGVTRVVRDVFIAGNTFTKAIVKALQYEFPKAEEAKKANGLLIDAEEKEKALQEGNRDGLGVSQAVSGVLKDLVSELHRSVDFYLSQGPERSIGRIVLAGGSARMKNLAKFLTGELKVPVTVLNPFGFLTQPPAGVPEEVVPAMGVAVGLALRKNKDWA